MQDLMAKKYFLYGIIAIAVWIVITICGDTPIQVSKGWFATVCAMIRILVSNVAVGAWIGHFLAKGIVTKG